MMRSLSGLNPEIYWTLVQYTKPFMARVALLKVQPIDGIESVGGVAHTDVRHLI